MSEPLVLFFVTSVGFYVAYHTYGRYLARTFFKINPANPVPAHVQADGKDYVASSRQVMFGHHFTSIAGTGPIVGPAIGIIWGWLPAVLWVVLGSIFMGAVHDFGALVLSMRHQGRSLADIAGDVIHPKAKFLFFAIVCLALLIVIAIFGLVIALIFKQFPSSVIAVWLEIPIAIVFGKWLHASKKGLWYKTLVSVGVLYITVYLGMLYPLILPDLGWMPVTGLWTIILLVYAFVASILPVGLLLQPRDFLNAWQLYVALGLIICGLVVSGVAGKLQFVAPMIDLSPTGAPSMWPFLFITIACGAISGFHCLVCSGTSSKQINSEADAQYVGYGSMLVEALLAIVILIAVGAGIGMAYDYQGELLHGVAAFKAHYGSWQASTGLGAKLTAVVIGCANMMGSIGIAQDLAIAIVGVLIASFAGTTLDSATRVQRYVISELGHSLSINWLANRYIATALAVITAAFLAFSSGMNGAGALLLWPLFGAVNQLLAALALLVISFYFVHKGFMKSLVTIGACVIIFCLTLWATLVNQWQFWQQEQWFLCTVNLVILSLALVMVGLARKNVKKLKGL